MRLEILLIVLIGTVTSSCSRIDINSCGIKRIQLSEKCNRAENWSGLNVSYQLTTDSAGLDNERINQLLLEIYDKEFIKLTVFPIHEADELKEKVKKEGCMEGFNLHSGVMRNENGILEVLVETYYVDKPDADRSSRNGGARIIVDLNQKKLVPMSSK